MFVRAVELPRLEGRIDHLTIYAAEQRLFCRGVGEQQR